MYDSGKKDINGNNIILNEFASGKTFEDCIEYKLKQLGFVTRTQFIIGKKGVSNSNHVVDIVLIKEGILFEAKVQNTTGTVDYKLMHEVWAYQYACDHYNWKKAYIIYGGRGLSKAVITNTHEMARVHAPNVTLHRYEDDISLSYVKNEIK